MPHLILPGLAVPKARPRFDSTRKRAYHDPRYDAWLEDASKMIAYSTRGYTEAQLVLACAFGRDSIEIEWSEASPVKRPKGVQGDLDNLAGSVMDALTQSGRIKDDKQVTRLEAWIAE